MFIEKVPTNQKPARTAMLKKYSYLVEKNGKPSQIMQNLHYK